MLKTSRFLDGMFVRPRYPGRTAKRCFSFVAAVVFLRFYWIRELLFGEAVVALGFVVLALLDAVFAFAWMGVLRLWRLGSAGKNPVAQVSATRQPLFAKATVTSLPDPEEEIS